MIEIKPDPKHPRGGFAEVIVQGVQAEADPVTVSIFNSYQQKWLGAGGWQPGKAELPARSFRQEGEQLHVIVGPDVVNHIEEDTPIRVEIGGSAWDTYWPDDINAGPDVAVVGNIGGTGTAPEIKTPTIVTATSEEEGLEEETPLSETAEDIPESDPVELTGEDIEAGAPEGIPRKSPVATAAGGFALLAIAAVAAYFLFFATPDQDKTAQTEPEPAIEPVKKLPQPKKVVATEPDTPNNCAMSVLNDTSEGGFSALADKMRECGAALSADNALGLIEGAAAAGDPEALALFGTIYDGEVTDEGIESAIGLSYPDQPDRAVEYYSRAVEAGSTDAAAQLKSACRRLFLKSDTLSKSAHEDFCQ